MTVIECTVPGDPIPKGRPREDTRSRRTYTPARTQNAQKAVAWALKAAYRGEPTEGPVTLTLAFRCRTHRRVDGDNLLKLVMDAGNGITWVDDVQVEDFHVSIRRGCPDPGTDIRIVFQ